MTTQTVTLTVQDQALDPVEGVTLELRRTNDDSIVTTGVTDSSGQVVITLLLNGGYYVLGSRSLLSFARQAVVVANTGLAQEFILDADVPTVTLPAAPELCKVYGFLSSSSVATYVLIAQETGLEPGSGGTGYADLNQRVIPQITIHPSREGVWEADLVRGRVYTVSIPRLSFQRRIRVPNQSTANIEDIPGMLGSVDLVSST